MPSYSSADFLALAPALILVIGALVLLMLEVFQDSNKRGYQAWFTAVVAALAALSAIPMLSADPYPILASEGRAPFAVADGFGGLIALTVCIGLALSALSAGGFLEARKADRGEFYALAMFSAAGMVLLGQATDLLLIFIAIEIMSVPIYALAAYLRRGAKPAEAAFKYFILGAFSTAILLYGIALVFGATGGKTGLTEIAAAGETSMLLFTGLALVAVGFLFKVAAAPFHMWAPDVYEGSPTPVTAFMAVGVKAAGFAAFVRVLVMGFGDYELANLETGWGNLLGILALVTMLVGNLLAVPQRSVKRMLAYSAIAHAGYLLLGVTASAVPEVRAAAGEGILFYLLAYTFTGFGAFAVVAALERQDSESPMSWDLDRFAGLAKRRPTLAIMMTLFMVSLAGIPPTVGFVGKLYLFRAAIDAGLYGLAIAGILTSVISLYYYLRVVVYMYMREPEGSVVLHPEPRLSSSFALVIAAVGTLLLGVIPSLIGDAAQLASLALGG